MGIQIEFNPSLALRAYGTRDRERDECLPEKIEIGREYNFLKEGQRNFWLKGEVPLIETKGNEKVSRTLASIVILESTHFHYLRKVYTKGKYLVKEVYDINDPTIHFEGMDKIK